MEFGEKLRLLRKEHNLTLVQLSEKCGISDRMLQKYETSKALPTFKNAEKLSNVLGIPMSELMNLKTEEEILEINDENQQDKFQKLSSELNLMMAGGSIPKEDMQAVLTILQRTFFKVTDDEE